MPAPPEDRLHRALQQHRAGNFGEAELMYRQFLHELPNNPDALHLLGFLVHQVRRDPAASELISRAISLNPAVFVYHNQLGLVLLDRGEIAAAANAFTAAIQLQSSFAEAHNNLGNALQAQDRFAEAIVAHRDAVTLAPGNVEFHFNLGSALKASGDLNSAAAAFRAALQHDSTFVKAHNNLGYVLFLQGSWVESIQCFRRAIDLKPEYAEAHNNLGNALLKNGRLSEALDALNTALRQRPNYPEAHYNLGLCLRAAGEVDRSIVELRRAIELKLDFAAAHWDLALGLLLRGELEEGWREFEWRLKWKDFPAPRRNFDQPTWEGDRLNGRTILLHPEQGLGDTIQFARYISVVVERGGNVVLECQPELYRLFQRLPGVKQIISSGQPLPAFDVHCPLLSLAFLTRLNSIPWTKAYLEPDPSLVALWNNRITTATEQVKVGLVWAGSGRVWTGSTMDLAEQNRSVGLTRLAPLAKANCQFFSLQKGPGASEACTPPPGLGLVDFTAGLNDFADTAALMGNLDLIITVDTAVAHVAAAMGLLVWVMLPFDADWRWSFHGEHSAWYPTARLFRQKTHGDWSDVIEQVAGELVLFEK